MVSDMAADGRLERRAVVRRLLDERGEALVVAGLGSPTWDLAAAGDHDRNFYMWGGMGSAVTIGLGLALAQRALPVLVITGDGEMLMGLGGLATAGAKAPANLSVVVLDNERFGETGMQKSHTAYGTDLPAIAAASGFSWTETVRDEAGLAALCGRIYAKNGCGFASVKIAPDDLPRVMPEKNGAIVKDRFRRALLGAA
ncbi:MAG TPA: thiamine pyrophosphate-dependent enzyme [Alphaproteobacteria bacterium]|nr:thiamine pyrophosphate-dependent enzyme [Alphaproteobacteria bacterium]